MKNGNREPTPIEMGVTLRFERQDLQPRGDHGRNRIGPGEQQQPAFAGCIAQRGIETRGGRGEPADIDFGAPQQEVLLGEPRKHAKAAQAPAVGAPMDVFAMAYAHAAHGRTAGRGEKRRRALPLDTQILLGRDVDHGGGPPRGQNLLAGIAVMRRNREGTAHHPGISEIVLGGAGVKRRRKQRVSHGGPPALWPRMKTRPAARRPARPETALTGSAVLPHK